MTGAWSKEVPWFRPNPSHKLGFPIPVYKLNLDLPRIWNGIGAHVFWVILLFNLSGAFS